MHLIQPRRRGALRAASARRPVGRSVGRALGAVSRGQSSEQSTRFSAHYISVNYWTSPTTAIASLSERSPTACSTTGSCRPALPCPRRRCIPCSTGPATLRRVKSIVVATLHRQAAPSPDLRSLVACPEPVADIGELISLVHRRRDRLLTVDNMHNYSHVVR